MRNMIILGLGSVLYFTLGYYFGYGNPGQWLHINQHNLLVSS